MSKNKSCTWLLQNHEKNDFSRQARVPGDGQDRARGGGGGAGIRGHLRLRRGAFEGRGGQRLPLGAPGARPHGGGGLGLGSYFIFYF